MPTPIADTEFAPKADQSYPPSGRDFLRAQMNALQSGLENLRRLRDFFDGDAAGEEAVRARVQRLVETLPRHDDARDAAWRIAAVATLTLRSGTLADVEVGDGYRLKRGSIGWDLGPEGSEVHAGFTPVTPATLGGEAPLAPMDGPAPLTDGIGALTGFEATLPDGLYRIVIMRNGADEESTPDDNPFGGDIVVNGSPVRSRTGEPRERLRLSAGNEQAMAGSTPESLGVEGWAIVTNGRLKIEFAELPPGRAITAIIAEPFEIDRIALEPGVAETVAAAMGDIAPAAGPRPKNRPHGVRPGFAGASFAGTQATGADGPVTRRGASTPGQRVSGPSATGFAANRGNRRSALSGGTSSAGPTALVGPIFGTSNETDDVPAFEAREILVKRSLSPGADSEGTAIDLGAQLDEASPTGIFLCASLPCADTPPIAPEPGLDPVETLLGAWLTDPTALPDDWEDLQSALAGREAGAEIAIVYEFDVDSEGWTDVELRASAGNGLYVWLDGAYIFGASEAGSFVDSLDFEYRLLLPDLDAGRHFLQLLNTSHQEVPDFALELRGTPVGSARVAAALPEPAGMLFCGLGFLGIAIARLFRNRHRACRSHTA